MIRNITIAAFVVLAVVAIAANTKLPFGYKVLVVQSGSMEPQIGVGSVLITKPTADFASPIPSARFSHGDVITYAAGKNNFVSHRVVDIQEKGGQFFYQTKGDANKNPDQKLIADAEVVGQQAFVAPYLGRFVQFAKTPMGYFLMILLPTLYIILSELWVIVGEIRKSQVRVAKAGIALPTALIIVTSFYFVGGTSAYFSDSANSTNNVFSAAESFCNSAEGNVVVNEVFYDVDTLHNGQGSENDWEWVELYNPTSSPVSLTGWSIADGNSSDAFPGTPSIPACGFAIVSPSTEAELEDQTNDGGNWTIPDGTVFITLSGFIGNGFANGGDSVILKNNVATEIDSMSYGTDDSELDPPVTGVASGHSLERDPDGVDTDTAADFVDRTTPQPGL